MPPPAGELKSVGHGRGQYTAGKQILYDVQTLASASKTEMEIIYKVRVFTTT